MGLKQRALFFRGWARGRLGALRARLSGKPVLHFIHIGKTGGTALKHTLTGHESDGAYRIVLHEHEFRLGMVKPGEKAFFFLRDPVERFRSGFSSRKRQGRPRHYYPWTRAEAQAFTVFEDANDLALALSSQDGVRREAAYNAMRSIQHVADSYVGLFGDIDTVKAAADKILFVGFQESLDDDFAQLLALLDLDDRILLPEGVISAHKSTDSEKTPLDNQAIDNIREWYAADYAIMAWFSEASQLSGRGQS